MQKTKAVHLLWHRRDFRTRDNTALYEATRIGEGVIPFFVIDPETLADFEPGRKPHAYFFGALFSYRDALRAKGKDLLLIEGDPRTEIPKLCRAFGATRLSFNKDYETAGLARDREVTEHCQKLGVTVQSFKDHVLFEEREILNGSGNPFRVFTPYKSVCFRKLSLGPPAIVPGPRWSSIMEAGRLPKSHTVKSGSLGKKILKMIAEGQAEATAGLAQMPGEKMALRRLADFIEGPLASYAERRNFPGLDGTSRISADLRSGALSPRTIWQAIESSGVKRSERETFLTEILWRDFFIAIGFNFPEVFNGPFNHRYSKIVWRNHKSEFKAWCEGRTGYPIVDAGMRQLVQTGFMHNRVRMITAMFLVKDLLIDWRWGERFFRQHLIDGDLSVNNGNWQWSAGTGSDAQPFFRVFNPTEQGKRFDRERHYIRKWIPELDQPEYPAPIVDHAMARLRCLTAYKRVN